MGVTEFARPRSRQWPSSSNLEPPPTPIERRQSQRSRDMGWAEKLPSGRYRGVYRDAEGRKRSAGIFTTKEIARRKATARRIRSAKTRRDRCRQ